MEQCSGIECLAHYFFERCSVFRVKLHIFLFLILIFLTFLSCDPATGIRVTNNSNYDIYIEYVFSDFSIPDSIKDNEYSFINNNININIGESASLIFLFQQGRVIEALGFGQVNSIKDILMEIDRIFISFDIYKVINSERIILYDKKYILDEENIMVHRLFMNYSIEYFIK